MKHNVHYWTSQMSRPPSLTNEKVGTPVRKLTSKEQFIVKSDVSACLKLLCKNHVVNNLLQVSKCSLLSDIKYWFPLLCLEFCTIKLNGLDVYRSIHLFTRENIDIIYKTLWYYISCPLEFLEHVSNFLFYCLLLTKIS